MSKLDSSHVPASLVSLIPLAEEWGIGDDFEREARVRAATRDELETLVHSIDSIADEDLFGWLSGPDSFSANPTDEYLAMTCLTMAIDYAKLRLSKM
jgi:hypothetical protein